MGAELLVAGPVSGEVDLVVQRVVLISRGGVGFHRLVQAGQTSPRGTTFGRQVENLHRQHGWPWPPPFHQTQKLPAYPDFRSTAGGTSFCGFGYGRSGFRPGGDRPATGAAGVVVPRRSLLAPTAEAGVA